MFFHSRTERKGGKWNRRRRDGGDFKGHHKREGAGGLWEKKKLSPKSTVILRKFVAEGERERRPIFPSLANNRGHDFSTAEPTGKTRIVVRKKSEVFYVKFTCLFSTSITKEEHVASADASAAATGGGGGQGAVVPALPESDGKQKPRGRGNRAVLQRPVPGGKV